MSELNNCEKCGHHKDRHHGSQCNHFTAGTMCNCKGGFVRQIVVTPPREDPSKMPSHQPGPECIKCRSKDVDTRTYKADAGYRITEVTKCNANGCDQGEGVKFEYSIHELIPQNAHRFQIEPPSWCLGAAVDLMDNNLIVAGIPGRQVAQIIASHVPQSTRLRVPADVVDREVLAYAWARAETVSCLNTLGSTIFLRLFPVAIGAAVNDMKIEELGSEMRIKLTEEQSAALMVIARDVLTIRGN